MLAKAVKAVDLALARLLPGANRTREDLLVLAFHSVLADLGELEQGLIDPYQPITLTDVETVARALAGRGYRFVTGRDIAAGGVKGPAAWLTFDDGYANNLRLVPLLRRLGLPATIFVASGHVDTGEAYWWDVLFREGRKMGVAASELAARREALKALAPAQIRAEIAAQFGAAALRPEGDLDRPMTPQELAGIATEPLIEIGNHTHRHTILPLVSPEDQFADIEQCQQRLEAMTGTRPVTIAFPNGDASPDTLTQAQRAGLVVGVTCAPCRTPPSGLLDPRTRLAIGRFAGLRHGRLERELSLATGSIGISQLRAAQSSRRLVS